MVELASPRIHFSDDDDRKRRLPKTESRRSKLIWPLKASAQLLSSPARSFNVDSVLSNGALHRALSSLVRSRHKHETPPQGDERRKQQRDINADSESGTAAEPVSAAMPENDIDLNVRQTDTGSELATSSASARVLSMGERGRWGCSSGSGRGDSVMSEDAVTLGSSRSFHCRTYAVPSPATSPEVTGDDSAYSVDYREEFHDLRRLRCGRRILSGGVGGFTPTSAKSATGSRRSGAKQLPVFRPKSSSRRVIATEYDTYYNTSWATAEPIQPQPWESCSPEYEQPSCSPACNVMPPNTEPATVASSSDFASPDLQFSTYNLNERSSAIFSAPPTYGRKRQGMEAPCFSPPTDEHGNPMTISWQDRYLLLCQAIATRAFDAQKAACRGYSCAPCDCSSCELSFAGDNFRRPASFSIPNGDRLNLGSGSGVDLDTFSGPLGYVSDSKLNSGTTAMYSSFNGGAPEVLTPLRRRRRWWRRVPSMLAKASPANYIIYLGAGHRRRQDQKVAGHPASKDQPSADTEDSCSRSYFSGPVASYTNCSNSSGGAVPPPDSHDKRHSSSKRWSFARLWRYIKRV